MSKDNLLFLGAFSDFEGIKIILDKKLKVGECRWEKNDTVAYVGKRLYREIQEEVPSIGKGKQ